MAKGNRPNLELVQFRVVDTRELVGFSEIAEELEWSRNTVANWPARHTRGFPAPVAWPRMGRLFVRSEVLKWAESTGRQALL